MIWKTIFALLALVQAAGMGWALVKAHREIPQNPWYWKLLLAVFWPILALAEWTGFGSPD